MTQMVNAIGPALGLETVPPADAAKSSSRADAFARMLTNAIADVDQKIQTADAAAQTFAIDDSVPVHQVTFALEQARLSFELMMQVRSRLVDAYQEFSRMQL
jgi:flagellar hook-basal body complex protein FliE